MKIVIVDDHPLVRKGLLSILSREEELYPAGEAETVRDAAALVEREMPDLVIVDVKLGDESGYDLVKMLRHLPCHFMMLTSSASEADIRWAEQCGADGFMLKEAEPEELLLAIRTIGRGRKYFSQSLLGSLLNKEADDPLSRLTPKEKEVLRGLGEGLSNGSMARRLVISEFTVKKHVSRIFQKLNLNDRTQAALFAQANGLSNYVPPERRKQEHTI